MPDQFEEIKFATERSHSAAKAANENSRPMAQSVLLINGAAATALIAFVSKDKLDPTIFAAAPKALICYAVGVALGAVAMFSMTESLDYWNGHWEPVARNKLTDASKELKKANCWWWTVRVLFIASVTCFAAGSWFLATAFLNAPLSPPINCF